MIDKCVFLFSFMELSSVFGSSYQLFRYFLNYVPSNLVLPMLITTASYVLFTISRLDAICPSDNKRQWEEHRINTFRVIKEDLRSWIVNKHVVGGSLFGGSVPSKKSSWKGKRELEVQSLHACMCMSNDLLDNHIIFSCGTCCFKVIVHLL